MNGQAVEEIAKLLNLPPLVILYLVWVGREIWKRNKQLDVAFGKIRALEARLRKRDEPEILIEHD